MDDVEKNDWQKYLPGGPGLVELPADTTGDQADLAEAIKTMKADVDALREIRGEVPASESDMWRYLLFTFLLVLALSIRFAKVTASIRGNTEDPKPATGTPSS